jgi:hypothetical protein
MLEFLCADFGINISLSFRILYTRSFCDRRGSLSAGLVGLFVVFCIVVEDIAFSQSIAALAAAVAVAVLTS